MHDIRAIRADAAAFDAALVRRGLPSISADILTRDGERRTAQTALQEKQARRNALAKEIGQGKRKGEDTAPLEAEATALRGEMEGLEKRAADLDAAIKAILEALPNTLDPEVPDRPDETANVELLRQGEPSDRSEGPTPEFQPQFRNSYADFSLQENT